MLCDLCFIVIKSPIAIQREHIEILQSIDRLANGAPSLPIWICDKCDENLKKNKLKIEIKCEKQDCSDSCNLVSLANLGSGDVKMSEEEIVAYGENAGNSKSLANLDSKDIKIKVENMKAVYVENTTASVDADISEEDANLCKSCSKICYLKDLSEKFICRECCPLEYMNNKIITEDSESYENVEIKVEEASISNVTITYPALHKSDFKAKKKLNANKYVKKLGNLYMCTKCPERQSQTYKTASCTRKHVKVRHFGYRYECNECTAKYTNNMNLRKHYKSQHDIEDPMRIELTNYELEDNVKLDTNQHFEKRGVFYVCRLCPESKRTQYTAINNVRRHIRINHYGHRYACPDCNEKYTGGITLRRHYKNEHSTKDAASLKVELTGGNKLLAKSHELAKVTRGPQNMNSDTEKVTALIKKVNTDFICTLCPKDKSVRYKSIQYVRRHIRFSHYGYRYLCGECGKKYANKNFINKHYKNDHNIEAPTTIELIRSSELPAARSNELKKEIKKIGNFYTCTLCTKTKIRRYVNFKSVQRHVKVTHQGYKYECSVCGVKYAHHTIIKKHYKYEHNQECGLKIRLTKNFRTGLCKAYKQHKQQQAEKEIKQISLQKGYVRKRSEEEGYFYFCILCSTENEPQKYKLSVDVERHIKISHQDYRYHCAECGTICSDLNNLKKHYKRQHKTAPPANVALTKLDHEEPDVDDIDFDKDIEQVSNYYVCKICFAIKYKSLSHLKYHMKMKHYGYSYECTDCNASYSDARALRRHYKMLHNKEAATRLALTRRLTKSDLILSSTMPSNSVAINDSNRQENPRADVAQKLQIMQFEIQKMEKSKQIDFKIYSKQLDSLYICTICSEANSQKYKNFPSLRNHIQKSHFGYRYECSECDRTFFNSRSLKTHWKKTHSQELPLRPTITKRYTFLENSKELVEDTNSAFLAEETKSIPDKKSETEDLFVDLEKVKEEQ